MIRRSLALEGVRHRIGYRADIHGVPIWFPTPGLVQHIGHASSLWDESPAEGSRRADRFSGDGPCSLSRGLK
ncbi:MAG: hypothetical protein NTZ32_07665 [Planctomycetales bacterium]|nr:hypothetical protein [Planctomycetales bacterium]